MTEKSRRNWASVELMATFLGSSFLLPVGASDLIHHSYQWVGESGSWHDPANWSPYGVPDPSIDVWTYADVRFSDSLTRVIDGVGPSSAIRTGNTNTGRVIWNISEGANHGAYSSYYWILLGSGTTLNMTGGRLATDQLFTLEAGATINQSGGLISDSYAVVLEGVCNLSGTGRLHTSTTLAISGTLNQTGGSVRADVLVNSGTYNLLAGDLETGWIRNVGELNLLAGGKYNIEGFVNLGIMNVSGTIYAEGMIDGLDIVDGMVTDINGTPGTSIYYDQVRNGYLGGLAYQLQGGGQLQPIPEPTALTLFALGSLALVMAKRR